MSLGMGNTAKCFAIWESICSSLAFSSSSVIVLDKIVLSKCLKKELFILFLEFSGQCGVVCESFWDGGWEVMFWNGFVCFDGLLMF